MTDAKVDQKVNIVAGTATTLVHELDDIVVYKVIEQDLDAFTNAVGDVSVQQGFCTTAIGLFVGTGTAYLTAAPPAPGAVNYTRVLLALAAILFLGASLYFGLQWWRYRSKLKTAHNKIRRVKAS